jgi:predicted aminopeptidase
MMARHRLFSAIAIAAAALLGGCGAAEFYWQGVTGQAELLTAARPIAEVVQTTQDPALKARLKEVQAIRSFASHNLGLPDNGSYTRYVDIRRPFVVWNVFAAPELSLTPQQWCFPIVGCVAYRGYFSEHDARAEAARLAASGHDVYVGGVPAYSTLGFFDDPVLSSFIRYREVELARLVFHELAHQLLYVKDDTAFNESFATAVEEEGVARWLAAESAKRGPDEVAKLSAEFERATRVREEFRDLVAATRQRLAAIYAENASDDVKRAEKAAAFAAMHDEYERRRRASERYPALDRWFASGANNAGIAAAGLYADLVPQFKAMLAAEGGDLARFYHRVKQLAALPKPERDLALAHVAALTSKR